MIIATMGLALNIPSTGQNRSQRTPGQGLRCRPFSGAHEEHDGESQRYRGHYSRTFNDAWKTNTGEFRGSPTESEFQCAGICTTTLVGNLVYKIVYTTTVKQHDIKALQVWTLSKARTIWSRIRQAHIPTTLISKRHNKWLTRLALGNEIVA